MAEKHPLYPIAYQTIQAAWGFRPDRDIKSVHLANGFFRHLCDGGSSEVKLLKDVVASRRGNSPRSSTDILRMPAFRQVIEAPEASKAAEQATERLRQALDEVLHQDGAFYAAARNSTLTLTHRQHLTNDTYDQGAGSLLAQVLLDAPGQPAVAAVRQALDTPDNTVYRLTQPLLTPGTGSLGTFAGQATAAVRARLAASCVLPNWQTCFATLTEHYTHPAAGQAPLEKTAFLQRAVSLAGIGLLLHLYNSSPGTGCQPLFLCADHPTPSIREIGRHSLALARRRLRGAFRDALRAELEKRGDQHRTTAEYEAWADTRLLEKERAQYLDEFTQQIEAGLSDFEAAVRALTGPGLKAAGSKSAESCASSLGQRLGLQWPRRQGSGKPYLAPVAAVYDALVSGLLAPGEVLPAEDFWQLAYERFGLLCGAVLPDDQARLASVGIRNASLADLQANARAVLDELRHLGYARTYADEVTLISASW
ncbi:hypothetical protein E5K00_12455 [Hymenobacter aquaticus]|uniref:Uncharacterized protein n=1 Tax=Hymenobacter aquaticus TaxID=1867101 RepID=A0A4Z0Q9Z7_9BACT|nr:hypothetical protein [Hymenobacter aquaticus]TGE25963.1 hypothetical protein E5K00_12455 [Hymenobacter aquaticus]